MTTNEYITFLDWKFIHVGRYNMMFNLMISTPHFGVPCILGPSLDRLPNARKLATQIGDHWHSRYVTPKLGQTLLVITNWYPLSISKLTSCLSSCDFKEHSIFLLSIVFMLLLFICCRVSVPNLQPNMGLFWYFFTEMFEHFRIFFVWVFQINVFIYTVPLAIKLW